LTCSFSFFLKFLSYLLIPSPSQYGIKLYLVSYFGQAESDQSLLGGIERALGIEDAQIAINPPHIPQIGQPISFLEGFY
jgi:hypothetical protein